MRLSPAFEPSLACIAFTSKLPLADLDDLLHLDRLLFYVARREHLELLALVAPQRVRVVDLPKLLVLGNKDHAPGLPFGVHVLCAGDALPNAGRPTRLHVFRPAVAVADPAHHALR